jgi:putative salt-induced outer membrane protein YdiY
MHKYTIIAFIVMAVGVSVRAKTATPLPACATNTAPLWQNSLSFGFTLARGNSDTTMADGEFSAHRNDPTNEVIASAEGIYGVANGVKNAELLHGVGQYNHLFSQRLYGYGRGDAFHDGVADVEYRLPVSPGLGYYFVKDKMTTFAGEAGPGGVFEKLDGSYENYSAPRLAEHLDHKWDEHTHFWESVEFLPQLDMGNNFLVNAEVGAEAPLTKRISMRAVLQDNFINIPAPGRQDNDLQLISGLVYKF